jgi:hypothetical protein
MSVGRTLEPEPNWSSKLPDKLKLAIADCILLYSNIESCIVELVWLIEDADTERRMRIARSWSSTNFKIVKQVIKLIPGAESDAVWTTLKNLGEERNLIGHGVWLITHEGRPMVVWHARSEDHENIEAQYFDWARFDQFLILASAVLKTFAQFKQLFEAAIDSERQSRQAQPPLR